MYWIQYNLSGCEWVSGDVTASVTTNLHKSQLFQNPFNKRPSFYVPIK